MFRISRLGRYIAETETIAGAREVVGRLLPGTYGVDEVRDVFSPNGPSVRPWGRLIRRPDGRIEDDPWTNP